MLTNLSRHLALSLPMYESDPPSGGGNPPANDPPELKPDDKVTFDARQQEAINALLASERKSTEEKVAARLQQEQADAKTKADAEAERKRQEAAGEFDKVRDSLTSERDAAITERDALKGSLETLEAYVRSDVEAVHKQITDAAKAVPAAKVLLDFHPGDDADITALLGWTAKAKAQLPTITEAKTPPTRGNGANPPPSDGKRDLKAALSAARANPKYSI